MRLDHTGFRKLMAFGLDLSSLVVLSEAQLGTRARGLRLQEGGRNHVLDEHRTRQVAGRRVGLPAKHHGEFRFHATLQEVLEPRSRGAVLRSSGTRVVVWQGPAAGSSQ